MTLSGISAMFDFALDQALRGAVVMAIVAAILALLRVRRARAELRLWTLVCASLLVMPIAAIELPAWTIRLPVPSVVFPTVAGEPTPAALPALTARAGGRSIAPTVAPPNLRSVEPPVVAWLPRTGLSARSILAAIYAGGVILSLASLVVGLLRWRGVRRRAHAVASEVESAARRVTDALGMSNAPAVLEADVAVPCVVGFGCGVVILPRSWRNWDPTTLDSVLTHEFSHVEGRDALVRLGSAIYRALFWFSPAAWWLHARLVGLTEDASDDAVLERGADAAAYAATLLCFATRTRGPRGVVAMADGRRIERRLIRITRWTAAGQARSGWRAWTGIALGAPLLVGVAVAAPQAAEPIQLPALGRPSMDSGAARTPVAPAWVSTSPSAPAQVSSTQGERVTVVAGRSTALQLPFDIKRVNVTNPDVADATALSARELLVAGKAPGAINLIVWGDGGARVRYDVEVSPSVAAPQVSGTVSPGTPAVLVALLFDLQSLPGDDRQRAVDAAKISVQSRMLRANVGLSQFTWYAVYTIGTFSGRTAVEGLTLTTDPGAIMAELDRVAKLPASEGRVAAPIDTAIASVCHEMSSRAARTGTVMGQIYTPEYLRMRGLSSDLPLASELYVFGNGVSRGLMAVIDRERFASPCLAEKPAVAVAWMDDKSWPNQPYRDFVSSWSGRQPSKPIAVRVADAAQGTPVRFSTTDAVLDAGYVSATVTNQSAKVIRSITLGALVTSGGKTRTFTRVGPAASIQPGGHLDISSAVLDPVDFSELARDGGTAVVGIVAVEFEDGTSWTGSLTSGGGAISPAASARR